MKRKAKLVIPAFLSLVLLISCNQAKDDLNMKDAATGNAGEILVVMSNAQWKGEMGKALRDVYMKDMYTVPQEEPVFDLFHIEKGEFVKLNKRNRNVVIPQIGEGAEYGEVKIATDIYSRPQTILYIKAPDAPSFVETVKENEDKLVEVFLKADRDRILDYLRDYHNQDYSARIKNDYHVFFAVPRNYKLDENREDFAWLSYETQKASHGYLIYHFGENARDSAGLDYFIKKRNEVLKENVPGEREGSYMTTETKYHYPIISRRMIKNEQAWIMEGLWKLENDFMGGPFASFIKWDKTRKEFVCIEAFSYDPRGNNRDQMRKMKAAMWTMDIPDQP